MRGTAVGFERRAVRRVELRVGDKGTGVLEVERGTLEVEFAGGVAMVGR